MRLWTVLILSGLFIFSCSKPENNRGNINFKITKDSIAVLYENKLLCPVFTKIEHLNNGALDFVQSESKETRGLLKFNIKEQDSISILKTYKFKHYYGYHDLKKQAYDTFFNYALPFPKGKQYKVIQGYNGNFTHNTSFSRYTIDFKLNIGDTIVAARAGTVIKVVDKHNKQGTTKKYKPYGNFILVHHKDNTFSQYVHLKPHGALVNVGDTLKVNQPLGLSGFTGLTTTPHLHFGVFKATTNGFISIPIILDSIPGKNYIKNKIAQND